MMTKVEIKHLSREVSRHGKVRWYVRLAGRRKRLQVEPGAPGFHAAYEAALASLRAADGPAPVERGSFKWLGERYFASVEFCALDFQSQRTRMSILRECFAEPYAPSDPRQIGDCPVRQLTARHVKVLRDRKAGAGKPGAANNRLKYLGAMFSWAVEAGEMDANPARDVRRIRYASDGFPPWTVADVTQFIQRHPPGTKPFLALALFLLTGARRGDLVRLGRQHVKDGQIQFVPNKTRHRRTTKIVLPYPDSLAAIVAASPCGAMTFLETEYGAAFTAKGFGGWWRKQCDRAGLGTLAAHGLRKAGAAIAAEEGATGKMLDAFFGWSSPSQSATYTKGADNAHLAREAGERIAAVVTPILTGATNVEPIGVRKRTK